MNYAIKKINLRENSPHEVKDNYLMYVELYDTEALALKARYKHMQEINKEIDRVRELIASHPNKDIRQMAKESLYELMKWKTVYVGSNPVVDIGMEQTRDMLKIRKS